MTTVALVFLMFLAQACGQDEVTAFGMVGLSLGPGYGLATELSAFGKILLALVMFAGRVEPITGERTKPRRDTYPEEDIAIG